MHSIRKRIGATGIEAFLAYFVRGLGAIGLFLLYAVIAKRMPPDESGLVFLGLAAVTILAPVSIVGLQMLSLRLLGARSFAEDRAEIRYIGTRMRWLAAGWSLLISTLLFLSASWLANEVFAKPGLAVVFSWLSPAVFCMGLCLVFSHQLQGLRRFSSSLFVSSIGTQLTCMVLLWFSTDVTPQSVSQLYSLASVFNLVIAWALWASYVKPGPVARVLIPNLSSSCFSFWLVNAMILIVNWSGQLIAGALVEDASQIALLAVAQRVANLVNFLLIGVNVIVTPRFARFWKNGEKEKLRELALKSTALISLIGLPIVLLLVVFSTSLLELFKPAYAAAAPLLVILALSQLFNVMTGSVNQLLSMCGYEHDLRNTVIVSGITTLTLTFFLTLRYGVMGTAIATSLALCIQNLVAVAVVRYRLGFSMWEAFSPQLWMKKHS